MLITFTEEEQQHIKEVQESFAPEWERLTALINEKDNLEEPARDEIIDLYMKRQAVYDSMVEVLDAYCDQCQRERFEPTRAAGTHAIIQDAKAQAPIILEIIHRETVREYEGLNAEAVYDRGVGIIKKGKFFVNADYATNWLKEELKLHIEALRDDNYNLQMLLTAIIEAVEASPYTDKEKPGQAQAAEVLAFKHLPLSITPDNAIFKANMPMYHGKATDALATLSHKDVTENPMHILFYGL